MSTGGTVFPGCLPLDLETALDGRTLKIGALFEEKAQDLVGHNLVRHDLPALAEMDPALALLQIPVVDTLPLSPLCFPENPSHRLVQDYKRTSESRNDSVANARFAKALRGETWGIPLVEVLSHPQTQG